MGVAGNLDKAMPCEQALVGGHRNPDAEHDPRTIAPPCLVLDEADQRTGNAAAARPRGNSQPPEIEILFFRPVEDSTNGRAGAAGTLEAQGHRGTGRRRDLRDHRLGGFRKRAGLRIEPAAILREGLIDQGRDVGGIVRCRAAYKDGARWLSHGRPR